MASQDEINKDPLDGVVEISPNKRYIRFQQTINKSIDNKYTKLQSSYKAFDTKNGIEVAWHIININILKEHDQSKFIQCFNNIKNIQQNKYITELLAHWFDKSSLILNIITSDLSILKDFINKVIITLRWKIIKRWCKQILKGLDILHQSDPVIIHRNINCSHIYIDSGLGEISLGDLWFSAILQSNSNEPIGLTLPISPAYCSPESLKSKACMTSAKGDIYSFGMCVLEMLCGEEPYFYECSQMTKTELTSFISNGHLPKCLHRILHSQAYDFITCCLKSEDLRPTAAELLQHEFLRVSEEDDNVVILGQLDNPINNNEEILKSNISNPIAIPRDKHTNHSMKTNDTIDLAISPATIVKTKNDLINGLATIQESENVHHDKGIQDGRRSEVIESDININTHQSIETFTNIAAIPTTPVDNTIKRKKEKIKCLVTKIGRPELQLAMMIPSSLSNKPPIDGNQNLQVEFEFDTSKDIYENVASEMVVEVDLIISATELANIIREQVEKVLESIEYKSLGADKSITTNDITITTNQIDNKTTADDSNNLVNSNSNSNNDLVNISTDIKVNHNVTVSRPASASNNITNNITSTVSATITTNANSSIDSITKAITIDNNNTNTTIASNISSDSITNTQTTNASPIINKLDITIENEIELQEYIDKLEKEARIARRTFEQRIQKHQSIQENCEEELQQIEEQYHQKLLEFERKEKNSIKKKEDEILKLKLEHDVRLQKFKNEKIFYNAIVSKSPLQSSSSLPSLSLHSPPYPISLNGSIGISSSDKSLLSKSGSQISTSDKKLINNPSTNMLIHPTTPNQINKSDGSL